MDEEELIPAESDEQAADDLYEHHRIKTDRGQEPLRIDKFLINRIEGVSRSKLQAAADAGAILVNGQAVKSSYKVKALDEISIVLSTPAREYKLEPENIPLKVVFEDDQLVVIDKPAGLVVHPGSGNYSGTLVNALLYHFKELGNPHDAIRPGLVHRIDKNTSGLILIAKNEYAMTFLAKQFFHHTIERKYIALVWGDMKEAEGTIEGHIGRHQRFRKKMDFFAEGELGKEAITHYKVLERFGYVTLVECVLETGRTHQIRVHMQHIGHPLFNDDTYGGDRIVKGTVYSKYKQFVENCFQLLPRQALHAAVLGFIHPTSKQHLHFESPLPTDMAQVIDKWRQYFKAKG
ncbi:MAG: RluA family pseudouridine synthase [Chitinophagales bacterium]|nr:RluA family pseudouridine synthase [Chitinophagales bacterium]